LRVSELRGLRVGDVVKQVLVTYGRVMPDAADTTRIAIDAAWEGAAQVPNLGGSAASR